MPILPGPRVRVQPPQFHPRPTQASRPQPLYRCKAKAKDAPATEQAEMPKAEDTPEQESVDEVNLEDVARSERVKAVAAKISSARALARKLSDEKVAARETADTRQSEMAKKQARLATSEAAVNAARADARARATKPKAATKKRDWETSRLAAENKALLAIIEDLARKDATLEKRLAEVRSTLGTGADGTLGAKMSLPLQTPAKSEASEKPPSPPVKASVAAPEKPAPKSPAPADPVSQKSDTPTSTNGAASSTTAEKLASPQKQSPPVPPSVEKSVPAPPKAAPVSDEERRKRLISQARLRKTVMFADAPPVPGTKLQIYINSAATIFVGTPLPSLTLKLGLNEWESIHELKLPAVKGETNLYSCSFELPKDLFALSYVIVDPKSNLVDNNDGLNFKLKLTNAPTEEEVLALRIASYEAQEAQRLKQNTAAEDKLWFEAQRAAKAASKEVMAQWRNDRNAELRQQARDSVAQLLNRPKVEDAPVAVQGQYFFANKGPVAGKPATLYYNSNSSELRHRKNLVVHIGSNGWYLNKKLSYPMMQAEKTDAVLALEGITGGDWYHVQVPVSMDANVLDWVISCDQQQVWDNNNKKDFHAAVRLEVDVPAAEEKRYMELVQESKQDDELRELQAGKKAIARIEGKAKAFAKRRSVQSKFLYTSPLTPKTGQPVEVFYNPDATSLRGRPEVWLRGSWNRWKHNQPFGPIKMEPLFPGALGFLQATVNVPDDALIMDLVFSDSGQGTGGFYDSKNGLDYHVPVTGAPGKLPSLKVSHIAVEMAPIAKVGGMGDVVTALGRAVLEEGHDVQVIMPKYDCIKYDLVKDIVQQDGFDWGGCRINVYRGLVEGLPTVFLEPSNGTFWHGCIYGRNDDAARFGFFCGAAAEFLRRGPRQDIVHCHDWQSAPVVWADTGGGKTVFTIHNLNYGVDLIGRAMGACDIASTVSPTYAQEISGHPAIAAHLGKMYGVINGIDQDIWDPSTDRFLPQQYDVATTVKGKEASKSELRKRMNLSEIDAPVVGVVTRLTHQKGIHLIKHSAWRALERGAQFVLLGSAPDPKVQGDFQALADAVGSEYSDRARLCFAFDEPLSHLIYAGCDIILVPSMFEPCGLTQMIGMRYGTVPVVRKTGGLNDTVFDVDDDGHRAEQCGMQVNGFNFEGTDEGALDYALNRAISTWYNDKGFFDQLATDCMDMDWSWDGPAQDYIELYYKTLK